MGSQKGQKSMAISIGANLEQYRCCNHCCSNPCCSSPGTTTEKISREILNILRSAIS